MVNGECIYATRDDVSLINELLHTHFDEQMEQLPLVEELEKMIEQKHVLLSMREGHVAGMLLFIRNFRIVQTEGVGQKWPHRTIKEEIIAEKLVKN